MRIVLMGYQTWGVVALRALATSGHTLPLVVTHPASDHPYEKIWADSVTALAKAHRIPVIEGRRADEPAIERAIREARADLILCSDWRTLVPERVLRLARLGGINIHDGLLPRYAGFAPINWAIANGESEVGLTAHVMTDLFDLGDIVVQRRIPVAPLDTATMVAQRVFDLLPEVTLESVARRADPDFSPVPQDPILSSFFHKRTARESRVDWSRTPKQIFDLIRAQSDPYPNAWTTHAGRRLYLKRVSYPSRAYCGTPGRLHSREPAGVVVVCAQQPGQINQGLVLEEVQPADGEPTPAHRWFRRLGEYLGDADNINYDAGER
ncbi:methionyl-tRNA formyltransferase [Sorangium sp. So ce1036]|uniref:methionyl-tRNA formyltransferase n=1 Tax=Sorangium sp. So ce1036 TaxID=3133328 RepID=UPI003F0062B7